MGLILHTERLTLLPFAEEDVDIAIALFTDPEIQKYTGGIMKAGEVRQDMPKWIRRGGNGGIGVWCVRCRRSGEKLGTGALLPMPIEEDETDWDLLVPGQMPDAEVEIGYYLKKSAWGKGYATEVTRRLLQFAFEQMPLEEVAASFDEGNDASRNVLLKSGFVDFGIRRCYAEDGPDLRITREHWLGLQD